MNKISERLDQLKTSNTTGLMTHLVLGYPDMPTSIEIARTLARGGADFLEIQIPFSDPVADGPTIMTANQTALDRGITVPECLRAISEICEQVDIPVLIMSYYNLVFSYGTAEFCTAAQKSGVSGLIIPDMPIEEEQDELLFQHADEHDLINITFVSPATSKVRLEKIATFTRGFTYCFSTYGITGSRTELDSHLASYIGEVRKHLDLPLGIGFGIKTPDHIRQIGKIADIAIVGSAIIDQYNTASPDHALQQIGSYVGSLKAATRR
ncbi:tryptophan synthase subunit alpha [Candidatus Wirthbacteria bacterium CG2_30_54_11]|uniref:Tryptophan synthase alpha chain n=1 Tax=Candidatus Wirthbacteria bacterium CG2_30_54_11 TaxID=1817892 RepID=A0A1J5IKQ9_9BACT|nr:MAG: tryptophan synthase subunit alpha [Candidatus Wirthbacteria bacterium CG2_30_54_11]